MASSSRPLHRTIPAFRNKASTATSELAKAPVCDEAARLPAAEPPDLIAAIRQPFRISEEACFNNFSGLSILSTYINLIRELVSGSKDSSQYSRTSSTPNWAELPTENTLENFTPFCIPASIIKSAVAPEPDTKSTPFGSNFGIGVVNTPL